jgi:dissimilatory sulfite reductase (desulfoviridin) alpha/beta subunit
MRWLVQTPTLPILPLEKSSTTVAKAGVLVRQVHDLPSKQLVESKFRAAFTGCPDALLKQCSGMHD